MAVDTITASTIRDSVIFPQGQYHGQHFIAESTIADYYWDANKNSWIFTPEQASGGRVTISGSPPSQRESLDTDLWIDNRDYNLYIYDGAAMNWIGLTNSGITASVFVNPKPPAYGVPGALWYNSVTGDLNIRYEDKNSGQWVALTGNGINQTLNAAYTDVNEVLDGISSRMEVIENSNYFQL